MLSNNARPIQSLQLEVQRLRELLARAEGERGAYREMAREAIEFGL